MTRAPKESPKALDAERALLGGLLEEPERLADIDALGGSGDATKKPRDFADDLVGESHRMLYRLLRTMAAKGEAIDLVTVTERVRLLGEGPFGGLTYVMEHPAFIPSTENLRYYADIIIERARLRRLQAAGEGLVEAATSGRQEAAELATTTASRLLEAVEGAESRGWADAAEAGADVLGHIDAVREGSIAPGLPFGFPGIDQHFPGGLERNSYTFILGRPAKGKTAGMLQIVDHHASKGVRAAIFSLEMDRRQIFTRTLARMTGVSLSRMRDPKRLTEGEVLRLRNASALLRKWPLHIDDTPGITIQALRSKVRALRLKHPDLAIVAVDYIQKVGNDDDSLDERTRIAKASWGLRMLAADYGLVVLAAAQLSRKADDVPVPSLSMIEHCSSLEQDVTGAIAITRPLPNDHRTNVDQAHWHIIKNRNGDNEITVDLRWRGETNEFWDPRGPEPVVGADDSLVALVPSGKVRPFAPRPR